MNKKIIALSMAAIMTAGVMSVPVIADDEPITVLINGEQLAIPAGDTQPFIEEGRTLVPMRAIFEALGAKVDWDGETRTIISYDPVSDVSITMQIDSNVMYVGETEITLDVPAKIAGDRTVVPIRAVAEGMSSVVGWDGDTRTVTVTRDLASADEGDQEAAEDTETAEGAETNADAETDAEDAQNN